MRILIADDDRAVRDALRRALTLGGYDVELAAGGQEALDAVATVPPDAVVLDIGMPDVDGLEVCRRLRRAGDRVPILMLTARDAVADRIEGLDAGADDYLVKPFSFRELMARMRALLRRTEVIEPGPLVCPDLTYDPESREVKRGAETLRLTVREGALFELLLRRRGKVVPRSEIQARIWEDSFDLSTNIIDVYINSLRKKLDGSVSEKTEGSAPNPESALARAVPERKSLIQTVRGVGYRLRESDPKPDA